MIAGLLCFAFTAGSLVVTISDFHHPRPIWIDLCLLVAALAAAISGLCFMVAALRCAVRQRAEL